MQQCASMARPSGAVQECGPAFIEILAKRQPESWYDLWQQIRYEKAPIQALVEDLWNPDLNQVTRDQIYEALKKYGKYAIPALLEALKLNDRNYENIEYEEDYPKIALVNIGDAAFDVLVKAIETPGSELARAAIKMLRMFGDDRAEPVLRRALEAKRGYESYIMEALVGIEQARHKNSPAQP